MSASHHFPTKGAVPDTTTLRTMRRSVMHLHMAMVFILQHERQEADTHLCDVKLIGAYSTEATANAAIERLRAQPGFQDFPDGFSIDEYEIDKDHWTQGFILT